MSVDYFLTQHINRYVLINGELMHGNMREEEYFGIAFINIYIFKCVYLLIISRI